MHRLPLVLLWLVFAVEPSIAASSLADLFADVPSERIPSGILLDRTLSIADAAALDGRADAPVVDASRWRQVHRDLRRAGADDLVDLRSWWSDATLDRNAVPIAVIDVVAERVRRDAEIGRDVVVRDSKLDVEASAFESIEVFTAAALVDVTHQGRRVEFDLAPRWRFGRDDVVRWEFDADDGLGMRDVSGLHSVVVNYDAIGVRTLVLRATSTAGTVRTARFAFEVAALQTPLPELTIELTATEAYAGDVALGDAYVYLAAGRTEVVQPICFVEGLDLDGTLGRDELYALLNTENLLEDLRALGYDVVVLNFDDATTYVQRNGLLVAELVQEMEQRIGPTTRFALAGASMGGVCSRYALTWLEDQGIAHRVDLLLSLDAPNRGANIPLGLQFWVDFFRDESAEAADLANLLDRPAARQLLVYHYRALDTGGFVDPLRTELVADLAALGDYPTQPRLVAIANGAGQGLGQTFGPGQQIVRWDYSSFFTSVKGNVWAVGDGPTTRIFEGEIRVVLIPISSRTIQITGSQAYDNAPGGTRPSMQQADEVAAPYGDIVALHPSHAFIPTVSALDLPDDDLFLEVIFLADPASQSPFDAVYAPTENQEHVLVTAENAAWFRSEVLGIATGAPAVPRRGLRLEAARPNPFNPATTLAFTVDRRGPVTLTVHDLRGRRVRTLVDADRAVGRHQVVWRGRDDAGRAVASGVYLLRLEQGAEVVSGRIVLVE